MDPYNLIAEFVLLLKHSNRLNHKITKEIFTQIEQRLLIKIDDTAAITLTNASKTAYEHIKCDMQNNNHINELLRRYIQAQL